MIRWKPSLMNDSCADLISAYDIVRIEGSKARTFL